MAQADDTTDPPRRPVMTRKDFLARVLEKSGKTSRSDVRAIVEAALSSLGEVLANGSDVDALPLGRVRLVREKDTERATVMMLKVTISKRVKGQGAGADLAGEFEAE